MSLFKCKMCGASLDIESGASVIECEYCGTQQTLPKLNDEKRANMYDRANHFRRNNEFDKAMGIYEQILNEDGTDAEAYWSLVLCRYGIEYVEDPASHKRIPTVNRAQFTSIFDDDNYKSALEYADSYQRRIYEDEAKAINEIQKDILAISQKEEPFDIFICYKETDNNGRRTPDSVLAQELYYQLVQEGFKVFFSRITLEDKLGTAYEPYIFAALNSAKVMVTLGTKPEYFNAVWVKNEWRRYLALIKQGQKKMLIPAYKDMDPYDLPEEFSHLQAQDMSKLGFMQDLIRGIKKIIEVDEPKTTVVKETIVTQSAPAANVNIAPLLKRVFMFLEESKWSDANDYCERILDIDPECAEAYLGKLMASVEVCKRQDLMDSDYAINDESAYKNIMRFGNEDLKNEIQSYSDSINSRIQEECYCDIIAEMEIATTEREFIGLAKKFSSFGGYKDAEKFSLECSDKAEVLHKAEIYNRALNIAAQCELLDDDDAIDALDQVISTLNSIQGFRDVDHQISLCRDKLQVLKKAIAEAEESQKRSENKNNKRKKVRNIILCIFLGCILISAVVFDHIINEYIPNKKYESAIELMRLENYDEAIKVFEELNGYKESKDKIEECNIAIYGESLWNLKKYHNWGHTFIFGQCEQDNNLDNGKEDIEWVVIAEEYHRVLLISKYILDYRQYKALEEWLNNDFLNIEATFSEKEKNAMSTIRPLFILNAYEANDYFNSDKMRIGQVTPYALAKKEAVYNNAEDSRNCAWWLSTRVSGYKKDYFNWVYSNGKIETSYGFLATDYCGVRPAMWITLPK